MLVVELNLGDFKIGDIVIINFIVIRYFYFWNCRNEEIF